MAKNRIRQRENRKKFTKDDRLEKTTIAGVRDTTPYFAMCNLTRNTRTEGVRYL